MRTRQKRVATDTVSCFLEQFCYAYISFIFQVILNVLFTLCKCNIKKREPLIKLFFSAFVRFKLRCKMSGIVLKCAKKKTFERGVIKNFAIILSYERTEIVSSNFRHSYKNV